MTTRNTSSYWLTSQTDHQTKSQTTNELCLVCCEVRQETHDVKSFFFKAECNQEPCSSEQSSQFKFLPGQFITLELPINGEIINRSYTISSAPTRPHTLCITVKRKVGGLVSNWLHDHIKPGVKIAAMGPQGEFTSADIPAQKYLLLSAGSGITPLMSMTRTFYELAENQDIAFIHSARSVADIIFSKELALIASNQSNFKAAFICETLNDREINLNAESAIALQQLSAGRLNLAALENISPDFKSREIFTCGPAPYMAAVRLMLSNAGFNMAHYHEESFSFEALALDELTSEVLPEETATATNAKLSQQSGADTATFSIAFTKSAVTLNCAPDEFILNAATAAGLRLPSACSKGLCGTCKSKLISGQVDMKHGGGIRQREIDQGMILICCSTPLSDLVIEK